MLTPEETELLTRIGPGTPCGDLLRRYWHPVSIASDLTAEKPMKRIRILGEDLVIYRNPNGEFGLVAEQCSHRGASLYYGFLEDGGLRCPYHGWLYDAEGRCVEQPFEPQQSLLKHTIRHPAYPVEKLGGFLWAYMGPPERKPLLPRWDILVREDGTRELQRYRPLNCNWLQVEENTADATHVYFLHEYMSKMMGLPSVGGAEMRSVEQYGFQPFQWGLLKTLSYGGDRQEIYWGRPLVFPNMLRLGANMHWRVPVDDTHTQVFWMTFKPTPDGSKVEQDEPTIIPSPPWNTPDGEYTMNGISSQDAMAWETQGPIWDRTKENLGASDAGIVLFRRLLLEQIQVVQQGGDPMALVRDPEANEMIVIPDWIKVEDPVAAHARKGPLSTGTWMDNFFDERYETYEVPMGFARWTGR